MFTRLARFQHFELRRVAPLEPRRGAPVVARRAALGPRLAMHPNDKLPGFRHPAGRRRPPKPVLACHWYLVEGRLECRWLAEVSDEAPTDDLDRHRLMRGRYGPSSTRWSGRALVARAAA